MCWWSRATWTSSPSPSSDFPTPWPRSERPAPKSTFASCSASPTRWCSASTATPPGRRAAGRARWRRPCRTRPTCAPCASSSCRPSTIPTRTSAHEGPEAFERCIAQAVPLSRQLVESAREGCDLAAAEGRARFLTQAKGLWQALPEGALRHQILGDIAALAQLSADQLASLWGGRVTRPAAGCAAAPGHGQATSHRHRHPARPCPVAPGLALRTLERTRCAGS